MPGNLAKFGKRYRFGFTNLSKNRRSGSKNIENLSPSNILTKKNTPRVQKHQIFVAQQHFDKKSTLFGSVPTTKFPSNPSNHRSRPDRPVEVKVLTGSGRADSIPFKNEQLEVPPVGAGGPISPCMKQGGPPRAPPMGPGGQKDRLSKVNQSNRERSSRYSLCGNRRQQRTKPPSQNRQRFFLHGSAT